MKKIVALILAVALVAGLGLAGAANFAEKDITVKHGVTIYHEGSVLEATDVNGETVEPFIYEGTTYLPIRAVAETLGLDVDFDLESGSVYLTELAGDTAKSAEYLEHYFGIVLEETVTTEAWNTAIAAIDETATALETETLTTADAIESAVELAGLSQVVGTYTAEKAAETIVSYGFATEVAAEIAPVIAAALDADMITATTDPAAELDSETAEQLLMAAVQISGNGRNYVGRVSDGDILTKVINEINSIYTVSDATVSEAGVLAELGPALVEAEIVTGYGLKYVGNAANFLPEYTIQYGHSDAAHAVQLLTILKSEGIDAYIQIEPKTSIFVYGGIMAGNEYDMLIEFDSAEDRIAFDAVVKAYAQKFPEKQKEDKTFEGLISGAWWTPLYSSEAEVDEQYSAIINNIIRIGDYEIHTFSGEETSKQVAEYVDTFETEKGVEIEVELQTRYTNNAFAIDYLPEGETVLEGEAAAE